MAYKKVIIIKSGRKGGYGKKKSYGRKKYGRRY